MVLSLVSCYTLAQEAPQNKVPRWVSDKGYWVVETNVHSQFDHIIRFYNNDNEMIHQETLTGKRLNTKRVRVKIQLKKALEAAVSDSQISKGQGVQKHYVSAVPR